MISKLGWLVDLAYSSIEWRSAFWYKTLMRCGDIIILFHCKHYVATSHRVNYLDNVKRIIIKHTKSFLRQIYSNWTF